MRIKKVSKTTQTGAQIIDGYSNSQVSGYSCDYINKMNNRNNYSTEETFTGRYWIDGKKIYRKVLHYTNLTVTAHMVLAHGIQNFERPIRYFWNGYLPAVSKWYTSWDNLDARVVKWDNTYIRFDDCEAYNNPWSVFDLVVEYTKTTD